MRLVACTPEFWEFVRKLRTDPRTSPGFIEQAEITPEQQQKYMAAHWQEFFIALIENEPAGFVGCVNGEIRTCTHPDFQKRGVGVFMMREIIKLFPRSVSKVKMENTASRRMCEAAGQVARYVIYENPAD
jgi:GNAT superfamily N-acetyltransferase